MRIVTRGDFDGLVCAALLTEAETIERIVFAEPREIQERTFSISSEDIIVNLPYHSSCGIWFDHHVSEIDLGAAPKIFTGHYGLAPSCARIVYDFYQKPDWKKRFGKLIDATDNIDSAKLNLEDILLPTGWLRIAHSVDPRTGFHPSHKYFCDLVEWIKTEPLDAILREEPVVNRTREFFKAAEQFKRTLIEHSTLVDNVVVTDLRPLLTTPVGSRFLIYALFPEASVSVRLFYTEDQERVMIAVAKSVINHACSIDIGNMLAEYGGGGHLGAGTCAAYLDDADDIVDDIVGRLNSN
jgi:hypothetical protein